MSRSGCLLLIFTSTFLWTVNSLRLKYNEENPRLLLISFDGFRPQYFQQYKMPTFQRFMERGVFAKIKPVFTSITYPNHYSMITGLSPERHGIVANQMYDKFLNESFSYSCCDYDNRWWQQNSEVMPIWLANQKAGNGRRSGAVGFVGTLSTICGQKIFKGIPYSSTRTFKEIVDTMTEWFMDGENPTNFVAIYFNEPDKTGHSHGPVSTKIYLKLQECDDTLAYIESELEKRNMLNSTNIVIASDHGMNTVDPLEKSVVLEHYIDLSKCRVANALPIVNIYTSDPQTALDIQKNLSGVPHCHAYLREDVPAEFNYNKNIRIGDVVFLADPGYLIFDTDTHRNSTEISGMHGYNNSDPEMQGILIAQGPAIAPNPDRSHVVKIVDIYPFMTEILLLERRNVDGDYDTVQKFLKRNDP